MKFKYKSTPNYFDLGHMTQNFVKALVKGEQLIEFDKFCKKNLEEAKVQRNERKKVQKKHMV